MIYGYARISTGKQNIERQIRNIRDAFPDAHISSEAYTGTTTTRPEWTKLYRNLKTGDTVIFDSVSRMSRNAEEGFQLYEELYKKGISLIFLKEPHINTDTYKKASEGSISLTGTNVDFILEGVNRYMLSLAREQIRLAFQQSEKEVTDLRQRTKEGLVTARLNGRQIGQAQGSVLVTKKSIEAKKAIRKLSKSFGGHLNDRECMKVVGISKDTYYKYKKQLFTE